MQTINTDHIRTEFSTSADENIRSMKKQIRIEENFDILTREIIIGGKKAGFFFIDGFVQEDLIEKLMQFFYSLKPEDLSEADTDVSSLLKFNNHTETIQRIWDVVKKTAYGVDFVILGLEQSWMLQWQLLSH